MVRDFSRKQRREEKDEEAKWARDEGFELQKPKKVAKIAYNRLYVPSEEPPKWYKESSLTSERTDAVKDAANLLRSGKVQYAKVYKVGTEDGIMWGVKTYPRVVPWYVKEGLVPDDEEGQNEEYPDYGGRIYTMNGVTHSLRKKTPTETKIKRAINKTDKKLKQIYGLDNVVQKAEKTLATKTKKKNLDSKTKKTLATAVPRKKKPVKKVVKRRK